MPSALRYGFTSRRFCFRCARSRAMSYAVLRETVVNSSFRCSPRDPSREGCYKAALSCAEAVNGADASSLMINRAAENNSMMHVIDEHLLDLAANRVRSFSQVTN